MLFHGSIVATPRAERMSDSVPGPSYLDTRIGYIFLMLSKTRAAQGTTAAMFGIANGVRP